jgi:hypothetical protein
MNHCAQLSGAFQSLIKERFEFVNTSDYVADLFNFLIMQRPDLSQFALFKNLILSLI